MIRNHPDVLAVAAILLITGVLGNVFFAPPVHSNPQSWGPPSFRHEFDMQRDRIQEQRDRFLLERDRFREELHRAFRFRPL